MFLDPSIFVWILPSSSKNSKKNFSCSALLYNFLSLKNDTSVLSKSNKPKNSEKKKLFCWHLEGH
jgi:hypothetical protein